MDCNKVGGIREYASASGSEGFPALGGVGQGTRVWFPSPSRDVAGRNCVPVELKISLWLLPSQMLAQGGNQFTAV